MLRLKQYLGISARPSVIDAVLDALEVNTRVEALYIQNFEEVSDSSRKMSPVGVSSCNFDHCYRAGRAGGQHTGGSPVHPELRTGGNRSCHVSTIAPFLSTYLRFCRAGRPDGQRAGGGLVQTELRRGEQYIMQSSPSQGHLHSQQHRHSLPPGARWRSTRRFETLCILNFEEVCHNYARFQQVLSFLSKQFWLAGRAGSQHACGGPVVSTSKRIGRMHQWLSS